MTAPVFPPTGSSPYASAMGRAMLRYQQQVEAQVEATVADLQARWQGVAATLDLQIAQLQTQMEAALQAGDQLSMSWITQAQRLASLKSAVMGDVAQFAQQAQQIVGTAQAAAASLGTTAAQEALAASVPPGINYTFGVPPASVLAQAAGAMQPGTPLANLFDSMGPVAAKEMQEALFTGISLGENPRQIARRMSYSGNTTMQHAEVIARTETMRAWRGAQLENYRANRDVVQQWEWLADYGPRCCGACIAMDGTFHSLDEELNDHICGRCSAIPITRPWSDILGQAGIDATGIPETSFAATPRQTGSQWLAEQSPEMQNRILGPAAAEAYRRGDINLEDLVGVKHSAEWGSSIQKLSLKDLGLDAQTYLNLARSNGTASSLVEASELRALSEARLAAIRQAIQEAEARVSTVTATPLAKAEQTPGARIAVEQPGLRLDTPTYEDVSGELFGHALSQEEVAGLVGAPSDAYVRVLPAVDSAGRPSLTIDVHAPDWQPTAPLSGSSYDATYYVTRAEDGSLTISRTSLSVDETTAGVSQEALAAQFDAAQEQTLSALDVTRTEPPAAETETPATTEVIAPEAAPDVQAAQQAAQQALDEAQAQLDAVMQQWAQDLADNQFAEPPDELRAAKWGVARAQAAFDAAQGGSGVIVGTDSPFASPADPFGRARVDEVAQAMFGHTLSNDELAALVGAPDGSFVNIEAAGGFDTLSISLAAPDWNAETPWNAPQPSYSAIRELTLSNGELVMHNETFFIHNQDLQGQGLGAQVFSDEVQTLSKLGVDRIDTYAAGTGAQPGGANGYYTWPRFGYVGELPDESLQALQSAVASGDVPSSWAQYTTVQELMQTPEGRAWWKTNGSDIQVSFDLHPDSLSMRLLNAYLREKGLA